MKIAVSDANIFIDLLELGVIQHLFDLPLEIHTTDRVMIEMYPEQEEALMVYHANGQFTLHLITDEDTLAITASNYNRGLSDADKSVLYVAEKIEAIVLTGDDLVRKNCHQAKIEIHGILWVLDQFVESNLIDSTEASALLNKLMVQNTWLPTDHCNERLNKWKNG